jgi:hypothetical protein
VKAWFGRLTMIGKIAITLSSPKGGLKKFTQPFYPERNGLHIRNLYLRLLIIFMLHGTRHVKFWRG